MKKRDYFVIAMAKEAWRHRTWILENFLVTNSIGKPDYHGSPFKIGRDEEGTYVVEAIPRQVGDFISPTAYSLDKIYLEDVEKNKPVFDINEVFILRAGEFPNLATDTNTTYGNALFNAVALVGAFGDRIPYFNKAGGPGAIEALYRDRIVSDPPMGEAVPDGKVSVAQTKVHLNLMYNIVQNLNQICVQSASKKILGVDPAVIQKRDELLEKHKNELNNLTVVADIIKQLVAMDKASFKGDAAEGFFIKGKQFDVVRFRTKIMHGVEHSFLNDGTFDLVTRSLDEGWDFDHFAALNNSLRDGSYNRGSKTALGGEAVKEFYRRYQNSHLVKGDCGSKVYIRRMVTKLNAKRMTGNFHVVGGELERLTPENINKYIGHLLIMRDPAGCVAGGFDYCETCFGNSLDDSPKAIANTASEVPSRFMSIFMAKMHGTSLKTTRYDFNRFIV